MRILFVLFCLPLITSAQSKPLVIEGTSPGFYITHVVAPKENYYSIGRLYNISPKEIAPFNNLQMENGLSLNQTIKIPLLQGNFLQVGNAGDDEVLVPLFHSVQDKEGLYRVSVTYNNLPIETIRKWNNLKADAVSNGTRIIVGYLKVKKELSALAPMAKVKPADPVGGADKNETTKDIVKDTKPQQTLPPAKEIIKEKLPVDEPVKKKPLPVVIREETQPVRTAEKATPDFFDGGVFKTNYTEQIRGKELITERGAAAIFKSTSGWQNGKYYCLHNSAPAGTIIKITNISNGKSVYAKSLDIMSDINQNEGVLIRLSNAAANELGAGENTFNCTLSFSK